MSPFLTCLLMLVPSQAQAQDKVDAKLLIGKWRLEAAAERSPEVDKVTLEFAKGRATMEVEGLQGKASLEGPYAVEGRILVLRLEIDGQPREQRRRIISLTESELVLSTEPQVGGKRKYKKMK